MLTRKEIPAIPAFFMNSIPKSGTHLLKQILLGLPEMTHSPENELYEGYPNQLAVHFDKLSHLKTNEFAAGHIYYSTEWSNMLKRLKMKQIFISRDPRDVVISFAHFIIEKYPYPPYDHLHQYLKSLHSKEERYKVFIQGVLTDKFRHPNIVDFYKPYIGWLKEKNTLCITFEDLVRSEASRSQTLTKMVNYLSGKRISPLAVSEIVSTMESNIDPSKSFTFRSGTIGNWRKEYDPALRNLFKNVGGKLLIDLGYEKDLRW